MKNKILIGMLLFGSLIKTSDTNLEKDLFEAVSKDSVNEVKRLLDEGVNVDATNTKGMTPLIVAAQRGKPEIVKILIEANADTTLKHENQTAYDFAFNTWLTERHRHRDYRNTIELLDLYSNIQYRKTNLDASALTIPEYIAEKTKNLSSDDNKPEEELEKLIEDAKNNEIDYIYNHFFPAYEKFVKQISIPNDSLPLIQFFCDFIAPRSGLLGIMATEIFISPQALYDCLKKLAENPNEINKINILNDLLEKTEIIIRLNKRLSRPDNPARFTTDEPE